MSRCLSRALPSIRSFHRLATTPKLSQFAFSSKAHGESEENVDKVNALACLVLPRKTKQKKQTLAQGLPLSELINFKAGDIIPIKIPEQVVVLAEEMPILRGQFGEHEGNAAVKVEDVMEIYDPEDADIKSAIAQHEQPPGDRNEQ